MPVTCLHPKGRYTAIFAFRVVQARKEPPCSRRFQMTSVADRIAGPSLAGATEVVVRDAAPVATGVPPLISAPPVSERELRLDLFRGLALWLIFIDHLPPNVLTWLTLRNYGFS